MCTEAQRSAATSFLQEKEYAALPALPAVLVLRVVYFDP